VSWAGHPVITDANVLPAGREIHAWIGLPGGASGIRTAGPSRDCVTWLSRRRRGCRSIRVI